MSRRLSPAALLNKAGTTLFRHEVAYVLGQMEAAASVPTLLRVLADGSYDAIVRHECGEALGAIADPSTLPAVEAHCSDVTPEVAETCQIAAQRVRWVIEHAGDAGAVQSMKASGGRGARGGGGALHWRVHACTGRGVVTYCRGTSAVAAAKGEACIGGSNVEHGACAVFCRPVAL